MHHLRPGNASPGRTTKDNFNLRLCLDVAWIIKFGKHYESETLPFVRVRQSNNFWVTKTDSPVTKNLFVKYHCLFLVSDIRQMTHDVSATRLGYPLTFAFGVVNISWWPGGDLTFPLSRPAEHRVSFRMLILNRMRAIDTLFRVKFNLSGWCFVWISYSELYD